MTKLILELFIGYWAIPLYLNFNYSISLFKVLIFLKDIRDLIFKIETIEDHLIYKLQFYDRDMLRLIHAFDIVYTEWCRDNNKLAGYDIVCLYNKL